MPDAAALRERVHGLTAAAPKGWDESKAKGYDPNYKFDEGKVKRDTDPGEEGQFDKTNGGGGGSKKAKSEKEFLDWLNKQPKETKDFFNWLGKQDEKTKRWFRSLANNPEKRSQAIAKGKAMERRKAWEAEIKVAPTVGDRQVQIANAKEKGWPVEQFEDGSARITTPDGVVKLPGDDDYLEMPDTRDDFIDYATSQGWVVEQFDDGSGSVRAPWNDAKIEFPSNEFYKKRDGTMRASIIVASGWTPHARILAAAHGHALPDGSFPIETAEDWYTAREALPRAGSLTAALEHLKTRGVALGLIALTARGEWDPQLHPRARDGKFIEVGGWVTGLFKWGSPKGQGGNDKNWRGEVVEIQANPNNPADPIIVVENEAGKKGYLPASSITKAAQTKAELSEPGDSKLGADNAGPADADFARKQARAAEFMAEDPYKDAVNFADDNEEGIGDPGESEDAGLEAISSETDYRVLLQMIEQNANLRKNVGGEVAQRLDAQDAAAKERIKELTDTSVPAKLRVRSTTYKGETGFAVSGTDSRGRRTAIFAKTEDVARAIVEAIKAGDQDEVSRLLREQP